jgi:ketosteroid isomerase-like protein
MADDLALSRYITAEEAQAHLEALGTSKPPRFTPEQIDTVFTEHLRAEQALDIDAVMETVAPEAIYESHPLGLVMKGSVAIREYYERSLSEYMSRVRRSGYRLRNYGDSSIVLGVGLVIRQVDGSWLSSFRMGVIEFDLQGRVTSERAYVTRAQRDLLQSSLRDDFTEVPGVYVLT